MKKICFVLLVVLIGTFIGCDNPSSGGGNDDPISSLTITGLGDYNGCELVIMLIAFTGTEGELIAGADGGIIQDGKITYTELYTDNTEDELFTTPGSYGINLNIWDSDDNIGSFMYTNGKSMAQLQSVNEIKCHLSGDTTIALNKFVDNN